MATLRNVGFALPLLLLLAGCASTPAKRIEKNQVLFDSFPATAQEQIRRGQIELGFTPEMTRLALGEPQRKLIRRSADGDTEVWSYVDILTSYDRQRVDIDGLTFYGPGSVRYSGGGGWITLLREKEILRFRLEFKNGALVVIEEATRDEIRK